LAATYHYLSLIHSF